MVSEVLPYLLFYLGEEIYAISTKYIREMLITPKISALPESEAHIRGVTNLRGKVVQVIDLRKRLGMQPLSDDLQAFDDMLQQRKKDHIDWLEELANCVREKRDFRFATNPHECKFGEWYDNFKTNNTVLLKFLPKFEKPHAQIHQTASEVLAEAGMGHLDKAMSIIDKRRNTTLAEMIRLIDNAIQLLRESNTEITVVLSTTVSNSMAAVTVDRVVAVEHIPPENLEDPPDIFLTTGYIIKIGRRKTDEVVSILDPNSLVETTEYGQSSNAVD